MKNAKYVSLLILMLGAQAGFGQGYGGQLTFQGLDHFGLHSAGARAMGGITVASSQDISVMFHNPAALQSLQNIGVSFGGFRLSCNLKQEQLYAPVRYYPNLSLLLEGLTAKIPDPDTSRLGFTLQDTVQRPFDDIGPNWTRSKQRQAPLQAMLAIPIARGKISLVAGMGVVEYADLGHYYQNNNVLSPAILSQRPLPIPRPTDDHPLTVNWLQSVRSRSGSIQGYGFAIACGIAQYNLAFGFSGLILNGNSDDVEQEVGRGRLTFYSNAFRADSVYRRQTKAGTSDFCGREFTISSALSGRYVSVGFSVKSPTTVTRTYTMQMASDTTGVPVTSTIQGRDKLQLPWRGAIGLLLTPREHLNLGLEYEIRPYDSVRYLAANGQKTRPWLSAALFRFGAEYWVQPWLAMRGGLRGEAEVFEPEGNYLRGNPVTYTIYSAGLGIRYSGLRADLAYEYSHLTYQDIWSSAISKNCERRQLVVVQLSYEITYCFHRGK